MNRLTHKNPDELPSIARMSPVGWAIADDGLHIPPGGPPAELRELVYNVRPNRDMMIDACLRAPHGRTPASPFPKLEGCHDVWGTAL